MSPAGKKDKVPLGPEVLETTRAILAQGPYSAEIGDPYGPLYKKHATLTSKLSTQPTYRHIITVIARWRN